MALENQNQEPSGELESVPDETGSVFDGIPELDENDQPLAPLEGDAEPDQDDDEAGSNPDEPKPLELSDELEIVIEGDEKITGSEIKDLLNLRENYTQQRMADTGRVREIEQQANQYVADRAQESSAYLGHTLSLMESVALGGYTREQIQQLWRTDPESANVLDARARQIDQLYQQANQQVAKWKSEYETANGRKTALEKEQETAEATNELKRLVVQPWAADIRKDQGSIKKHVAGLKIPAAKIDGFMNTVDGVKTVYQSMLWEQSQARIKAGKVAPKVANTQPGSRAGSGQIAQSKQFKALESSARAGNKSARNSYLSALIPTLKD